LTDPYTPPSGGPALPPSVPAGWYPDPGTPGQIRYWDGYAWGASAPALPRTGSGYATTPSAGYGYIAEPPTSAYVGPLQAVGLALTRWRDYRGRSTRSEYWWVALVLGLGYLAVVFAAELAWPGRIDLETGAYVASDTASLVEFLLYVPFLVITLPLSVRRLHDTGKSWAYLLFGFIPVAGPIILIVLLCGGSEPYVNAWGPPRGAVVGDPAYTRRRHA